MATRRLLITWSPEIYNRFKVFVSWLPTFPEEKRVTSGDTLLKTTSWRVPAKKWRNLCSRANPVLYIKVLDRSKSTGVKESSEVVAVTVK